VIGVIKQYGRVASQAARQALRAWPLALGLPVYAALVVLVLVLTSGKGFVGGIFAGFGMAAIASSYLHLLALAVVDQKITLTAIKESFGARIWDVISVMFAFMIINLLAGPLLTGTPKGPIIAVLISLAMAVFFNPVPELLYQSQSRSFGLLAESARFISRYGLEWLFPNIILAVIVLAPTDVLDGPELGARLVNLQALFSLTGLTRTIISLPPAIAPLMLILLHWAMIFRGLLFAELSSGIGNRQQRVRDVWGKR
jgi:hypothetical protein